MLPIRMVVTRVLDMTRSSRVEIYKVFYFVLCINEFLVSTYLGSGMLVPNLSNFRRHKKLDP